MWAVFWWWVFDLEKPLTHEFLSEREHTLHTQRNPQHDTATQIPQKEASAFFLYPIPIWSSRELVWNNFGPVLKFTVWPTFHFAQIENCGPPVAVLHVLQVVRRVEVKV